MITGRYGDIISIHALREEGDTSSKTMFWRAKNFYPRPPRGGRRHRGRDCIHAPHISIHALREEGDLSSIVKLPPHIISIHALREEGDRMALPGLQSQGISIHALREEGDVDTKEAYKQILEFLSTPSARRATWTGSCRTSHTSISIHALREEGDPAGEYSGRSGRDFYPRPPRGGRPTSSGSFTTAPRFLSTPSARRATVAAETPKPAKKISIHALREEGDFRDSSTTTKKGDFYPRPPRGGRPFEAVEIFTKDLFLSTPSARRATCPY